MTQEIMSNFTTVNIVVLVTSIGVGIYCLKKALDGDFVKYRWVVLMLACAFIYDLAVDFWAQLHVLPFALLLVANFVISYLIFLGKMEPRDTDNEYIEELRKMREKDANRKSTIFDVAMGMKKENSKKKKR